MVKREVGLHEYEGGSIGGSNKGVISRNATRLKRSPCFVNLEHEFLRRLKQIGSADAGNRLFNTNLNSRAGVAPMANFKPGFALDLAMQISHGDKNLAFALIGVCGNDDITIDLGSFRTANPIGSELVSQLDEKIHDHENKVAELNALLTTVPDESKPFVSALIADQNTLVKGLQQRRQIESTNPNAPIRCPHVGPENPLTVPGSLGDETNLNRALRDKVGTLQNAEQNKIHAKYYHFIAGSTMGCELARECQLSPFTASKLSGLLSDGYRGVRLCDQLKVYNRDLESLTKLAEKGPANGDATDRMRYAFKLAYRCADPACAMMSSKMKEFASDLVHYPQNVSRDKLDGYIATLEAARQWQMLRVGGPNSVIPCTPWSNPVTNLPLFQTVTGSGCKLTAELCGRATKRLQTWDVDFEWSRDQHSEGARFGAQKCAGSSSTWDLDTAACKALNQGPSSPAEPESETTR